MLRMIRYSVAAVEEVRETLGRGNFWREHYYLLPVNLLARLI